MSNSPLLHPAIEEANCFPLAPMKKTPTVKWQNFTGPLPKTATGYGIDCGRSGLVVIDLDTHDEDANGLLTWQELVEQHGGKVGDTFTVSTPNGGLHLYYKAHPEIAVRNSAGKLGKGIDVRGQGGYVVGPNSIIKTSEGLDGSYEVVRDEVIQDLPRWLLELLNPPTSSAGEVATHIAISDGFPDNYARKALESAYYVVSTAPSGQRNDTLNKEAYGAAKAGAPVARVIADLTRAALTNGLSQREIDATVKHAAEEGAKAYVPRTSIDPVTGDVKVNPHASLELKKFTKEYYLDQPLGERWAEQKKGKLLYEMESAQWLRYEEEQGIWMPIKEATIRADAASWLRKEFNEAFLRNESTVTRYAERCLNKQTADSTLFGGKLHLLISSEEMDTHKDLLVVANGVVNLRTGQLGPFDAKLHMTKRVAYPFDPTRKSKYWGKVLEALPEDAVSWLQVMTGQSLTGYQSSSDVCMFLFGGGSNGKSTLLDILTETAGTYGGAPPQSSLMRKMGHAEDFGLIRFKGVRQALVEELPDERNLDVKAIKNLVGTRSLTARGMYRDYETFENQATLWVTCNRLPNVSETDHGTWRRLLVVPFPFTFKARKSDITEASHKLADTEVKKNASRDEDTIVACLAWRIAGAKQWYADSSLESVLPPSVADASRVWRTRSDHILAWTEAALVPDDTTFVLTADLRDAFNHWLRQNGYSVWGAKLFIERFETSEFYGDNKLVYNPKGTVPKGIRQAHWTNPDGEQRTAGKQPSHVLKVRFRTEQDDVNEVAATRNVGLTKEELAMARLDEMADDFAFDDDLFLEEAF